MEEDKEYREEIIAVINKVLEEINSLKNELAANKRGLEEIKHISDKLKEVKRAIQPKEKSFNDKLESLNIIKEELSKIRSKILLGLTERMFDTIRKNLLDGMQLESINNNSLNYLIFDKEKVGSIEVLEEHSNEVIIRVSVYENSEEFKITDPSKMYSIISFINTKFNYKQTQN